jgi:hypothetical protein
MTQLEQRTHKNVVAVAVANKIARVAWAVLARGDFYRAALHGDGAQLWSSPGLHHSTCAAEARHGERMIRTLEDHACIPPLRELHHASRANGHWISFDATQRPVGNENTRLVHSNLRREMSRLR